MDTTQFKELIDAIPASKERLSYIQGQLTDLKREVQSVQEKTSHELAQKISKSTYQFKRKGNKVQYSFNLGIEESTSSAQ